jgi:phenylacetate-coenzyme A ligase PaaK-like adenylate-forming protein
MMDPRIIFSIADEDDYEQVALKIFRHQARHVSVYRNWIKHIGQSIESVKTIRDIPFLPIAAFRSHAVVEDGLEPILEFSSSGTTGQQTSRHLIANPLMYEESFLKAFQLFYGDPKQYCILALLPSYLERQGSSLVYMTDRLIRESEHPQSGFYLNQYAALADVLTVLCNRKQPTVLLGVTYALLDLAEQFPLSFQDLIILETGGMKGKRKELMREELHGILQQAFHVPTIHSEYGMTELLSQAYSMGNGLFDSPPWMKICIRDINDPFSFLPAGSTGGINVIDLANIHSCSFLATDDLGKRHPNGQFEVLGRFDHSDLRGCNLMVS